MTEKEKLINFNVKVLKDGIRRVVNNFPGSPQPALSLPKGSQRSQR